MTAAPGRVLIVRMSSIGDVIHTFPAYLALRRAWPSTLLGWAVEPAAAPLVQRLPGPLMVHVLDTHRWRRRWWSPATPGEIRDAIAHLRARRYELAIDFQGLVKSAVVARLSGATVLGLEATEAREPLAARLYHRKVAVDPDAHVVGQALTLAAAAGAPEAGPAEAGTTPAFPGLVTPEDRERVERALARAGTSGTSGAPGGPRADRPWVVIHSAHNWESKRWPSGRWAELGRRLHEETRLPVLWIWGPGELERTRRIAGAAGPGNRLAPSTGLTDLAALLESARLFVGGDSAPLHLAVALGTPCVGVFGPTDPARTGPLDPVDQAVHRTLPCSFCHRRSCPLGTRECLEELAADPVVEAALGRLENGPPHAWTVADPPGSRTNSGGPRDTGGRGQPA